MAISFIIIKVSTRESSLDTLWNTLEDTIHQSIVLGTNLTNSTALVNYDFLGIKLEINEEE
jgi:hypothetical protein